MQLNYLPCHNVGIQHCLGITCSLQFRPEKIATSTLGAHFRMTHNDKPHQ